MARELLDARTDYDVIGDGVVDCTQNLLDLLSDAKTINGAGDSCIAKLPGGDILVKAPLVLEGDSAAAPCLLGMDGGAFDKPCTRLVWGEPAGGTMLTTSGFNRGRIIGVAFKMNNAAVAIHGSASSPTDPTQLVATAAPIFERITISYSQAGAIGIAFGTDPSLTNNQTFEFASAVFRDITYIGPGTAIKSLCPGNCKDFDFENIYVNACDVGLDLDRGSGNLNVWNFNGGNVGTAFKCSGGQLKVVGYEIETTGKPFRLLTGTMDWGTSCSLESGEVHWSNDSGSAILCEVASAIHFARGQFDYRDASGNLQPFVMHHNRAVTGTNGSFVSEQCEYWGCYQSGRPYIPIYDGQDNDLSPQPGGYGASAGINPRVTSKWDKTTDSVPAPHQCTNFG